jgi:hypothetical protein
MQVELNTADIFAILSYFFSNSIQIYCRRSLTFIVELISHFFWFFLILSQAVEGASDLSWSKVLSG